MHCMFDCCADIRRARPSTCCWWTRPAACAPRCGTHVMDAWVTAAQDMAFDSVSHLINYHIRARIPIISRGRHDTSSAATCSPAQPLHARRPRPAHRHPAHVRLVLTPPLFSDAMRMHEEIASGGITFQNMSSIYINEPPTNGKVRGNSLPRIKLFRIDGSIGLAMIYFLRVSKISNHTNECRIACAQYELIFQKQQQFQC